MIITLLYDCPCFMTQAPAAQNPWCESFLKHLSKPHCQITERVASFFFIFEFFIGRRVVSEIPYSGTACSFPGLINPKILLIEICLNQKSNERNELQRNDQNGSQK